MVKVNGGKQGCVLRVLRNLIHIASQISILSSSFNFKPLLHSHCSHLTHRITFLTPLFHELLLLLHHHNDVVSFPFDALPSLQQALLTAKELLHFGAHGSQLYMILEREQIQCKFNDLASHFEQAISNLSCHTLDISDEVKEQVALVTAQFRRAKEHFEPPGLELYDHLLCIYNNQSSDGNAELRLICEKLHFVNVEDIKQESLALHRMLVEDRAGCCFEKKACRGCQ